jgi:Periplasmic copper-binding protein CueP
MNPTRVLALAAAALLTFAGCSSTATGGQQAPSGSDSTRSMNDTRSTDDTRSTEDNRSADDILSGYHLNGLSAREVIDRLDRTAVAGRPRDLKASVRPGQLLVSDSRSGAQTTLRIPGGTFYLSIAPYVDQTHKCFYHSLTTCKGELSGAQVHVTITNRDTGAVLIDETTQTFDNGFVGFWLPADTPATVRVEHNGRSATGEVSTGPDGPTCLTTLKLA